MKRNNKFKMMAVSDSGHEYVLPSKEEIPAWIIKHRNARFLTGKQLGELLGVTKQAVGQWESGRSSPSLERIVSMIELFHGEETTDAVEEATSLLAAHATNVTKRSNPDT